MFGPALFLPAAGYRSNSGGSLNSRGSGGDYWSTGMDSSTYAYDANFYSGGTYMTSYNRAFGFSVRCIAE